MRLDVNICFEPTVHADHLSDLLIFCSCPRPLSNLTSSQKSVSSTTLLCIAIFDIQGCRNFLPVKFEFEVVALALLNVLLLGGNESFQSLVLEIVASKLDM